MIKNYLLLILTSSVIFSCSDPTEEIEFPRTYNYDGNIIADSALAIKTNDGIMNIAVQGSYLRLENEVLVDIQEDTLLNLIDNKLLSITLLNETTGSLRIESNGVEQSSEFNYTFENGTFTFPNPGTENFIQINNESISLCQIWSFYSPSQQGIPTIDGEECSGESITDVLNQEMSSPSVFTNDTVGVYELNFIFR